MGGQTVPPVASKSTKAMASKNSLLVFTRLSPSPSQTSLAPLRVVSTKSTFPASRAKAQRLPGQVVAARKSWVKHGCISMNFVVSHSLRASRPK